MKRIQRKRTAGWRMPDNTVYVGRGTPWGNPYIVGHTFLGKEITQEMAVELYRVHVYIELPPLQAIKDSAWKLRGKNLACWCAEGQVCHADVLLELANN